MRTTGDVNVLNATIPEQVLAIEQIKTEVCLSESISIENQIRNIYVGKRPIH